jgi:hypothetical protein
LHIRTERKGEFREFRGHVPAAAALGTEAAFVCADEAAEAVQLPFVAPAPCGWGAAWRERGAVPGDRQPARGRRSRRDPDALLIEDKPDNEHELDRFWDAFNNGGQETAVVGLSMPCSGYVPISTAIEHVVRLNPSTVMDVGHGYGKWGFLIREALDFTYGRFDSASWAVRIDGIDAFPITSPLLDWVYDSTRVANVMDDIPVDYDLIVLGDGH